MDVSCVLQHWVVLAVCPVQSLPLQLFRWKGPNYAIRSKPSKTALKDFSSRFAATLSIRQRTRNSLKLYTFPLLYFHDKWNGLTWNVNRILWKSYVVHLNFIPLYIIVYLYVHRYWIIIALLFIVVDKWK